MKVVLELLDQPSNIRKITVRHDIVIGRGADCNLRLSAPQISRRHCFLRVEQGAVSVTDLDSSNGTYLNSRRIDSGKRHDVKDGMTLAVGPIRFAVSVRPERVCADVLQAPPLDDSINLPNSEPRQSGSTVIEADDPNHAAGQALYYSIEQGGAAADEHEPTADLVDAVTDEIAMDSEAEIVDLGRRIIEFESHRHRQSQGPLEADQQFGGGRSASSDIVQIPDDAELMDDIRRHDPPGQPD